MPTEELDLGLGGLALLLGRGLGVGLAGVVQALGHGLALFGEGRTSSLSPRSNMQGVQAGGGGGPAVHGGAEAGGTGIGAGQAHQGGLVALVLPVQVVGHLVLHEDQVQDLEGLGVAGTDVQAAGACRSRPGSALHDHAGDRPSWTLLKRIMHSVWGKKKSLGLMWVLAKSQIRTSWLSSTGAHWALSR